MEMASEEAPPNSAIRTANPLPKPMGGNFGAAGSGGGAGCSASKGSSRCGLPHLWQKRASSGSVAPQVQRRGTISVCHDIYWRAQRIRCALDLLARTTHSLCAGFLDAHNAIAVRWWKLAQHLLCLA
jgi:hypothetical protein